MTENKDSKNKNSIAQDNTTNELSEKDVASVAGGNFIPPTPNKTTSFSKTPNDLSQHELGSVSGGGVPDAPFATKNKNFVAQNETQLSDHELASISGGGLVTDVLGTTADLVGDVTKTATDVVKKVI